MKLKPEVKEKWLAALRSGEYKQGFGVLRNSNNEFCCLGVLCEVAVQEGVIPAAKHVFDSYEYEESFVALPRPVSDWAGLPPWVSNPELSVEFFRSVLDDSYLTRFDISVTGREVNISLADLNDSKRFTFEDIAKVIEKGL